MAEKTDQEIIEELGLEQDKNESFDSNEDSLEPVSSNEDQNESTNTEDNNENSENSDYDNNTIENEDNDETPVQKKKPKILKLLIAVIAGLSVVLTIGTILYLTGFYDEEEVKKEEAPKAQAIKVEEKPEVDINDIDKNKLNQKLKMLTKTEILDKEELEAEEKRIQEEEQKRKEAEQKAIEDEKKKEEEKIAKEKEALEKEKQLLEERQLAIQKEQEEFLKFQAQIKQEFEEQKNQLLKELENQKKIPVVATTETTNENSTTPEMNDKEENKEEPVTTNEEVETNPENNNNLEETNIPSKEDDVMNANLFLPFINVAVIKGDLHKEYLEKVENIDKKISLCRDTKNRIEIYFGPYESMKERTKVFNTLMDNGYKEAYLVDFTKEEYEKRCKY